MKTILLKDETRSKDSPFPKNSLEMLSAILRFYLEEEYLRSKEDALKYNYHAAKLAKELNRNFYDPDQNSMYNGRETSWMKETKSMHNIFKLQTIKLIEMDFNTNKDFDIIELYFRFKYVDNNCYGEGPGCFPYSWEGKGGYCNSLKEKLCGEIIQKLISNKKISTTKKQLWFMRLGEYYNQSTERHKELMRNVSKKTMKKYSVSDKDLYDNKHELIKK